MAQLYPQAPSTHFGSRLQPAWTAVGLSFYPVTTQATLYISGFGGLEVVCRPLVPRLMGSNPAEAVGFLRATKSSARLPS